MLGERLVQALDLGEEAVDASPLTVVNRCPRSNGIDDLLEHQAVSQDS